MTTTTTTTLAERIAGPFEEFCTLLAGAYGEQCDSAVNQAERGNFVPAHQLAREIDKIGDLLAGIAGRAIGAELPMRVGEELLDVALVLLGVDALFEALENDPVIEARILAKFPEVAAMLAKYPELADS